MSQVKRGLAWNVLERFAGLALGLVTTMILSRILSPKEVGVFSLCAAGMAIAAVLRDFGVGEYLVQAKEVTRQVLKATFAVAMLMAWTIAALVFFTKGLIAEWYGEPALQSVLAVLCLNFVVLPFASPAMALLHRQMAFRQIFAVNLIGSAMQAAVSVWLAVRGVGPVSLAWGSFAGIAAQTAYVSLVRARETFVLPSFRFAGEVLHFGFFQVGYRLLDAFTSNAHEFMISRMLGFGATGLFSRAKGLIDMVHGGLTTPASRVAFPAMAQSYREANSAASSLVPIFAHYTQLLTGISATLFGVIAVCAPDIVSLMFGAQWNVSGDVARLLALAMIPSSLCTFSGIVMSAVGAVRLRLQCSIQWAPVHLLGVGLACLHSLEAVAVAWLLTNLTQVWVFNRALTALLRCSWRELLGPSLSSVPAIVLTTAAAYVTRSGLLELDLPLVVRLVVVSAVVLPVFVTALLLARHPLGLMIRDRWHAAIRRRTPS